MGNIIELPAEIYNRIAAGEVIENPASVVKELLENSLDAGSAEIKMIIKQSGRREITVTDNGAGMDKDDLYLAIKKHTTSKIKNLNDLNKIKTMGFRGEALSSVVSIAIVELNSKNESMESGIKLTIEDSGKNIKETRVSMNRGTTVKVSNLFYNTPARLKFLKGDKKELLNIKDIVLKLVIPNYNVNFQINYDDEAPLIFRKQENILERIKEVYGVQFYNELIPFEKKTPIFSIHGYLGKPSFNKSGRNYQFLFLNKRPISTNFFNYWLSVGYENLIMSKRYPVGFIFIEAPSDFFDVNVHPAKREVRFVNEYLISQALITAIKETMNKNLFIPDVNLQNNELPADKEKMFAKTINHSIDRFISKHKFKERYSDMPALINKKDRSVGSQAISAKEFNPPIYTVLFNTYILYEDPGTDSIFIIDQHACHERILYEQLKRNIEKKEELTQNLLIPINLHLSGVEYQTVMDNIKIFNQIGYNIEDFGNNSIIINSLPAYLENIDDKQLFLDILSDLLDNKKIEKTKLKEEILKSMACKSAIKAGEKLSTGEIEVLINELLKIEVRYTCPHGRPALLRLEKNEIEKWFKRK